MNQTECKQEVVIESPSETEVCQLADPISFGEDTESHCLNGVDDIQEDDGPFKPYRDKIRELKEKIKNLKAKNKELDEDYKYQKERADSLHREIYWGG